MRLHKTPRYITLTLGYAFVVNVSFLVALLLRFEGQIPARYVTGYWIAAISELASAKGWPKDSGKKTKKAWNEYNEEMSKLGIEFSKASAGKGAIYIAFCASTVISASDCVTTPRNTLWQIFAIRASSPSST